MFKEHSFVDSTLSRVVATLLSSHGDIHIAEDLAVHTLASVAHLYARRIAAKANTISSANEHMTPQPSDVKHAVTQGCSIQTLHRFMNRVRPVTLSRPVPSYRMPRPSIVTIDHSSLPPHPDMTFTQSHGPPKQPDMRRPVSPRSDHVMGPTDHLGAPLSIDEPMDLPPLPPDFPSLGPSVPQPPPLPGMPK
eukprot:gnl/Dysnectes_brevis/5777_a8533_460.p1 GENE.gnl/Dysnectes_brevis/5777_a8533_460~~gnl/Dysnectes_brevis/5777_a8533_460.p1  ORF type:complete len:192 (+),score=29.30 gnl/Dysnectes_brevis/5777_a8533_460:46-621(+)